MWELAYKEAEHQRNDAFALWCCRRLLRVPWTVRRSNQSILKEISPGCSFEGLMVKLKLQYFGHLMQTADSFEKTLMLGKIEGGGEGVNRGRDIWMVSPTQCTCIWASSGSWWWTVKPGNAAVYAVTRVWHDWRTGLNWTVSVAVPLLTGTGFWELIVPLKWAMVEYLHDGNWQALQISLPAYH